MDPFWNRSAEERAARLREERQQQQQQQLLLIPPSEIFQCSAPSYPSTSHSYGYTPTDIPTARSSRFSTDYMPMQSSAPWQAPASKSTLYVPPPSRQTDIFPAHATVEYIPPPPPPPPPVDEPPPSSQSADTSSQQPLLSSLPESERAVVFHQRVTRFYAKYEPSKMETVDKIVERFKGNEDRIIEMLVRKYGPEPPMAGEMMRNRPPAVGDDHYFHPDALADKPKTYDED